MTPESLNKLGEKLIAAAEEASADNGMPVHIAAVVFSLDQGTMTANGSHVMNSFGYSPDGMLMCAHILAAAAEAGPPSPTAHPRAELN